MSSHVGLQKKDTKYLQWDATGELCNRAASKTPVCLCLCRNGHAEGQGAVSTQTPCLVNPSLSLSVVLPRLHSASSSKRFSRSRKGRVALRPHWAHECSISLALISVVNGLFCHTDLHNVKDAEQSRLILMSEAIYNFLHDLIIIPQIICSKKKKNIYIYSEAIDCMILLSLISLQWFLT